MIDCSAWHFFIIPIHVLSRQWIIRKSLNPMKWMLHRFSVYLISVRYLLHVEPPEGISRIVLILSYFLSISLDVATGLLDLDIKLQLLRLLWVESNVSNSEQDSKATLTAF